MNVCNCTISFGNTGKANCEPIQDVAKKFFFIRTFASDGTKNSIPVGTVIDETYKTERLNDADQSKRWYPTRPLIGVEDVRADPATEDIDGVSYITDDGVRTVIAYSIQTDAVYLGKISGGHCGQWSIYVADKSNRIVGEISADGSELYPLAIEEGTFYTSLIKTQQGSIQRTQISFAYSTLISDEDLRLLIPEADMLNATGLLDINATITGVTTTGFVADLDLDYGYFGSNIKVEGWLSADFEIYNVTQAIAVVPISVTEDPAGKYTFVFAAQTSADVYQLTDTRDGFELDALTDPAS